MNKITKVIGVLIVSLGLVVGCQPDTPSGSEFVRRPIEPDEYDDQTITQLPGNYTLVWADEFNYVGSPDSSKWNYELGTGNGGWGNNELQFYTNSDNNSYVSDGHLTIKAIKENISGCNYSSARLTTKNKADVKYGYIEARIKMPKEVGTWPAFWMMPTNNVYGWWPNSGEIDIVEYVGRSPYSIFGTLHTAVSAGTGTGRTVSCPNASSEYNTYGMYWTEDSIKMVLNGEIYYEYNHLSNFDYQKWPFDQEFFCILNLAIGGNLGGAVPANFSTAEMLVDYVRVYKQVDKTDKVAPEKADIISLVPTSDSIHLEWNTPKDNQGIKQYDIVVDGKQVGATVSNSYTVKGLSPDTNYTIQVLAVDYNDNYSISDKSTVNTTGVLKIPGTVYGYSYSNVEGEAMVIASNDQTSANVLQFKSGAKVTYSVTSNNAGKYNINFRLAAALNGELKVEVFSGDTLIYSSIKSVYRTYGSYKDIALDESANLPAGNLRFEITFNSETKGNAIQLNYFKVE